MNTLMMNNCAGFFLIFFALLIKACCDFTCTKNLIKEQKIKKIQSKERREKILESLQDTHMIFDYFLEINKKLPDPLHNIMLLYCLRNDFYAEKYIKLCKGR